MKKVLLILTFIILGNMAFAQMPCTPNGQTSPGASYILADSATALNNGWAGQPYEQIVYMKAPKDTTFTVFGLNVTADVDSFVVDANIVGLPAGLTVSSVPGILPPSGGAPKTNFSRMVLKGDSLACVKISGTLSPTLTPGDKNLTINIRAYLSNVPFPLGPTLDTPSVVDYYKITIDAPGTGTCLWPASVNSFPDFNIHNLSIHPNPAADITNIQFEANKAQDFEFKMIKGSQTRLVLNLKG